MRQHINGFNEINRKIKDTKKVAPAINQRDFTGEESLMDVDKQALEQTFEDITENYQTKFLKSIMVQAKEYPEPVSVITITQNGEILPFLTLKSMSLWQGKKKSKKTTALAIAVAAFIRGESSKDGVGFNSSMDGIALFFDNEQGESYAARTMKLILKLANVETSPKLIYCDLREFLPYERQKIIEAGIKCTENVRLVVVDGLVDLLNDFMDSKEGQLTIMDMLKLCSKYDIHIAGVLHQNKNDKNPRAHIGTISSQKCEVEICTEKDLKDPARSIVSCVDSRGIPFEPFSIRWDRGDLPCISQELVQTRKSNAKPNNNYQMDKEAAEAIFKQNTSLKNKQAVFEIMKFFDRKETIAKGTLARWLYLGLVSKGEDHFYRLIIK